MNHPAGRGTAEADDETADTATETDGASEGTETAAEETDDADETTPAEAGEAATSETDAEEESGTDTAPEVELSVYQVSVRVTGSSDDDLETVEESARGLVDHLVDRAVELEDEPDGRGLG